MDVFPSFWKLEGKTVLVIGGGDAAVRKLRLVTRTPGQVSVFATGPIDAEIESLRDTGRIALAEGALRPQYIPANTAFAIVATEDDAEAEAAIAILKDAHVPVNAGDRTDHCDFVVPSIVDRDSVVVGISTGGAAPVLARNIRETIESALPEKLGALARFAASFRPAVAGTIPHGKQRKAFWERFFDGAVSDMVLRGEETAAREAMLSDLNRHDIRKPVTGDVTVIELEPTQPDLLSLRGLRRLQRADIVFHDARFDSRVLELVRRDADRHAFTDMTRTVGDACTARVTGLSAVILTLPGTAPGAMFETLRHGSAARDAAPAVRFA